MSDYLMHHGIKDQKWYRRRFQNKDGSLTPAGKRRYGEWNPAKKKNVGLKELKNVDGSKRYAIESEDGTKVGNISTYHQSDDSLRVSWIGVENKFKRDGYASSAMEKLKEDAIRNGYKKMSVVIPKDKADIQHIYERLGFKSTNANLTLDEFQDSITTLGDVVKMELDLTHYGEAGEALFEKITQDDELMHYGVGHLHGGHSGRYPWGSGKDSKQSQKAALNSSNKLIDASLNSAPTKDIKKIIDRDSQSKNREERENILNILDKRNKGIKATDEDLNAIDKAWHTPIWKNRSKPGYVEHWDKVAALGLKALQKMENNVEGDAWYDPSDKSSREWFLYEDQTIGKPAIADLIIRGYSANDCFNLVRIIEENSFDASGDPSDFYDKSSAAFEVSEGNWMGADLGLFAEYCEKVKNSVEHSDLLDDFLQHYGVGPDDDPPGRGSGRYAKGTGKDPYQHDPVMKKKMGLFDAIGNRIKKFKEDREETKRIQKEWDEAQFKLAEEGRRKEKRLEALAKARETRKANKEKAAAEKAEREKHEAEKKAAIASGDPEKISKFLTEMTNQEQYDAITRMGQVNKINAAAKAQADARAKAEAAANYKPSKLELVMSRTEKLLDGGMRVRDAAEKGIKIWNTMASLNNAFNDNFKMPKIDTSIPKPDDKKDKKPDNRDFRFFDNSKAATNSNPNTPPYGSSKNQTSENRGNTENRDYSSNADRYVSKKERENNHANEKKSFEDVINKTRESRSSNDNAIDVEFREVKSETIRPLLSSLSSASKEDIKKDADAGSKYFMTVINGGGSYPGSSSESASNYAHSRSEENRRYNEWESSQASASSQRMKNEERARQEASEKYTRKSSQRENRLKREAQQYRYAERIFEERIKARDADRERNHGNNWRHYDEEVKEAREDLDRLRKDYLLFRKYL